jgi:hypothetical protein
MKVVLQAKAKRQYLDEKDRWTANPEAAHVFSNGLAALRYCEDHHIKNSEILYQFEDPRLNFAVPLSDLHSAAFARGFTPGSGQSS